MANLEKPQRTLLTFPNIDECKSIGCENDTVVAYMDGTLLTGCSSFPYFALVAFEVGGILRLVLLLLASPTAGILYYFIFESARIRVLIFATLAGIRASDIESVARAVLPKFCSSDLHPATWHVFSSRGKCCVLTANPKIVVEPFLKDYLGTDIVLGMEIHIYRGRATGLVKSPGVLVGENKAHALRQAFSHASPPDIEIGDWRTDFPFMSLCKESHVVTPKPEVRPVSHEKLPKPVVFRNGCLVEKP